MRRELLAWIDDQLVGRLADENGIWSFQYESGWQAFGLCPQLPLQPEPLIDGSSQRPVQWYFDNLLPEEGQRQLLAQDARLELPIPSPCSAGTAPNRPAPLPCSPKASACRRGIAAP